MITRIFRVKVKSDLKAEFEPLFQSVSLGSVKSAPGCTNVIIGGPTEWSPDEYSMITIWKDKNSLIDFVGLQWNEAHIPAGMEKFVDQCWVHHYINIPTR